MTIIITYQQLPPHIPALVHANQDDSYTIIINKNLSEEGRKKAIGHEVNHIAGGDLYKDDDVGSLEASCHENEQNFLINENIEIFVRDGK